MEGVRLLLDESITAQARRTPRAPAVVDDTGALDYAELDARAGRLAGALRAAGVRPDDRVAVRLDRSVDLAVAVLGVLRAGGAFVPVETETPAARVDAVLDGAGVAVCVADRPIPGRTVLGPEAAGEPATVGGRHPDQLCAVYFTSGSTGRPKGVACTHRGWANRIDWMQARHGLRPGETVLHKTTLTFDDAAVELLWPLTVGGRVAMLAPGGHRDPRAIIDAAIAYGSVHLQFVPSMFDLFLAELTDADAAAMSRLRSVLCSGEALRPALVKRFLDRFGDRVSLDNTWGATEVSIDSTFHVCGPADAASGGSSVCVGVPMTGNHVYVLDPAHAEVPDGDVGELCIGGIGPARGYLGDPRRTAAAFVPDPKVPGARMYRTGDQGFRRPDGGLMFVERIDDQVKIRGVRIELGEVEVALRTHPAVRDAAVVAVDTGTGDKQLAAYAVGACTPTDLRAHVRTALPSYAVPTWVTMLDALPRHPNGKVDRVALATRPRDAGDGDADDDYVAPRTVAEETVAAVWAAVLGVEKVSVTRAFVDAGGHSLLALRILGRLRQAFDLELPLALIFAHPTIAECAAALEDLIAADVAASEGVR